MALLDAFSRSNPPPLSSEVCHAAACRLGLCVAGTTSVLFEPIRQALWRLGEDVGGVGGVGGLTNQYGHGSQHCIAGDDDGAVPYCFRAGWLGFTPFGGTMLLLCTFPLLVAALSAHRAGPSKQSVRRQVGPDGAQGGYVTAFSLLGTCASALWFLVPLASYAMRRSIGPMGGTGSSL